MLRGRHRCCGECQPLLRQTNPMAAAAGAPSVVAETAAVDTQVLKISCAFRAKYHTAGDFYIPPLAAGSHPLNRGGDAPNPLRCRSLAAAIAEHGWSTRLPASAGRHAVALPHAAVQRVVAFFPRGFRRTCKEFNRLPYSVLLRWIRLSFIVSVGRCWGKWSLLCLKHTIRGIPILHEALVDGHIGHVSLCLRHAKRLRFDRDFN